MGSKWGGVELGWTRNLQCFHHPKMIRQNCQRPNSRFCLAPKHSPESLDTFMAKTNCLASAEEQKEAQNGKCNYFTFISAFSPIVCQHPVSGKTFGSARSNWMDMVQQSRAKCLGTHSVGIGWKTPHHSTAFPRGSSLVIAGPPALANLASFPHFPWPGHWRPKVVAAASTALLPHSNSKLKNGCRWN